MGHVKLEYSRNAVKRASKLVGRGDGSPDEIAAAKAILSNFRSAHAYPLNAVAMTARKRALSVNQNAVFAQRMKRLPTVMDKLERHPNMSITTMQDLGGCRVIFPDISEVFQLANILGDLPKARVKVVKKYDYLLHQESDPHSGPKASGYRGIHLVYDYQASKQEYRGLKIELQIRTQLQHAWATAVETMDLFSGTRLKYSSGDDDIKKFFALVSSLMAMHENLDVVPGMPTDREMLVREIKEIDDRMGITRRLSGYAAIVGSHANTDRRNALTLELVRSTQKLSVKVHETQAAAEARLRELEAQENDDLDAVLVNIAKVGQLQAAYPNYYADTDTFRRFVSEAII